MDKHTVNVGLLNYVNDPEFMEFFYTWLDFEIEALRTRVENKKNGDTTVYDDLAQINLLKRMKAFGEKVRSDVTNYNNDVAQKKLLEKADAKSRGNFSE